MDTFLIQKIREYRTFYKDLSLKTCYVLAVRALKDSGIGQLPSALWELAVRDMLNKGYNPMTGEKIRRQG